MTNDTTTLNGALAELGETMATNITAKGVSASASDGLTTLAGKISQISQSGGGTPVVEFDNTNFGTHFAFTRPDGAYKDTFVVNVPSTVTDIESYCFYYLQNMSGVNLPTGLKTIDTYAFYYCKGLTSVTLPTGLTSIGASAFAYCQGLASITIPNTVISLSSGAFERCSALTSVTIGTGLTSLPAYCFSYCTSLTEITIPSNITSMGNSTLGNCTGMQKIRFESATPPTATSSTFQNLPTTCVIEVPCDSLSLYTSASNYPSSSTYTYVPYGCNGLKFGENSYITTTGSCELSLRLWDNNAPVSGGTITITGSDSSSYTCTTDSNGEATCTVTNVTGTVTYTATYSNYSATCTVTQSNYYINDAATSDNTSTLFGDSIDLRNGGSNTIAWNSGEYYLLTNTGSQKESMRVLTPLTGITANFVLEYDSYVEQTGGSSGFVIYNSSTSWEKLTDDADNQKKYWYGYNNGSFHETAFYGNTVTNQKWVHYKYTINGSTFTMEVTYNGNTVVTHSETIHLTRGSSTKYGLDSEWQTNTKTRYKNIQAYPL